MICQKCGKDILDGNWESGKTYKGIDDHHNPPQFMLKDWKGQILKLCRDCHRELHDEIIKILWKYSNSLIKKKSEYWTWIHILPKDRILCVKEITNMTLKWLREEMEDDTQTTTKS